MHGVHQVATPRRYLPSVSLLAAFEAVCRTGSAAEAARELSLTQGTVSRLVQSLEDQLGVRLFRRERKRLYPTEAARTYAQDVRRALDGIARATLNVVAGSGTGALNLAILPTFGTHWLAPRLPDFIARNPGVTVNLTTRLRPFDFEAEGFDAAIHFGLDTWPRAEHMRLADERVVAVAAPAMAEQLKGGARKLLTAPLLQLDTRPNGWRNWFRVRGVDAPVPRGMVFDQFGTMMQAAIGGIGVALVPDFLAEPAIADGRLVKLSDPMVTGVAGYWLVWPEDRAGHPPLKAFRDWMAGQVKEQAAAA
jgi:DNA-binding transcriptional LysR family regulator